MITIIVLWILLGIIAVIVILLHFSITAQIDLNKKGFDLKVRYMFFDIYPRKPKKKKQKRSKKAELPEDSFDDFEEFEDNIEESLPVPQTDDTPDKTGEVSEQIIEAKELIHGAYKLQLSWTSNQKNYFKEEVIFIN